MQRTKSFILTRVVSRKKAYQTHRPDGNFLFVLSCLVKKIRIPLKMTVVVLILSVGSAMGQEILEAEEFTQEFSDRANQVSKNANYKVLDDLWLASFFNNRATFHRIDSIYKVYLLRPNAINVLFNSWISRIDSIYRSNPDSKIDINRIVPVIKHKNYITNVWRAGEENLMYEKYDDDLIIIYAEDRDEGTPGYRFFSNVELSRAGFPKDSLHEKSIRNLNRMLSDVSEIIKFQDGLYFVNAYNLKSSIGKYMSSLLLLKNIWNYQNFNVEGAIVIAIPQNYILAVTGSKDRKGLAAIREFSRHAIDYETANGATNLYILKKNRFVKF